MGIDIHKEREAFEIAFKNKLGAHGCQFDLDEDGNYEDRETLCGWYMWLDGRAQAVPEGFVLIEKKSLRDTYYWDGCEYVVDHPSEYEMELERGEITTLEKWQRTKETKVYCANIYSNEDDFEVVQFETAEEAEKAVAENKAMSEAQEPAND